MTQLYKEKHNHRYNLPLPVKDWSHPAQRVKIEETQNSKFYSIEIFTDIRNKVGAGWK